MRVGTILWSEGNNWQVLRDFAKRADELGYEIGFSQESWGREAYITLADLAWVTKNIRLAPGIANLFSRTPGLMAQLAATLDVQSNGRGVVGLGLSSRQLITNFHGIKFEHPIQRTREYIEIIRLALSGERVNYDGEIFKLQGFRLNMPPPEHKIPIYVAAMGPRNIRLCAELADGVVPFFPNSKDMGYMMGQIAAGAQDAGKDPSEVEVAPFIITCITEDPEEGRAQARAQIASYVGGMGDFYFDLIRRYGYIEETDAIKEAWVQHDRDRARSLVTEDMVDSLTIAGTPSHCRDRLDEYHAAGVNLPIIYWSNGASKQNVEFGLELLAPKNR